MPRPQKRATARRRDYTVEECKLLTTGVALTTRFGALHKGLADLGAMREAWDDLRDGLLPEWIESHPFTRPVAWLLFEANVPRVRVVGEQFQEAREWIASNSDRVTGLAYRLGYFRDINRRLGIDDDSRTSSEWESEKQYLARIGALTTAELALL